MTILTTPMMKEEILSNGHYIMMRTHVLLEEQISAMSDL